MSSAGHLPSYRELHQQMLAFAAGLRSLGLRTSERVSLFSENSSRWLVADQGIMFNGAADAVCCPQHRHGPLSVIRVWTLTSEQVVRAGCVCSSFAV